MTDKLKIGILDLLTILLPGAFLLLLLNNSFLKATNAIPGIQEMLEKDWIFVAVFLSGAYVLGHFVFFIASSLDNLVYEKVKKVYWHDTAKLTAYVLQLKQEKTGIDDPAVLNAFKWSTGYLMSKQPSIYAEVERYMAESKFFRSLVIVLLIATFKFLPEEQPAISLTCLLMVILSIIRYLTQRQKAIVTAYQGIIITNKGKLPAKPNPVILSVLKRDLLYPGQEPVNEMLQSQQFVTSIHKSSKFKQSIRKFSFTVGLCFIPNFERRVHNPSKQENNV